MRKYARVIAGALALLLGTIACASFAEGDSASIVNANGGKGSIVVLSPRNYQVFQRRNVNEGTVLVSGRVAADCDRLEVRILGQSLKGKLSDEWKKITVVQGVHSFAAEIGTPAGGWYSLELRALKAGKIVAEAGLERVGVGEVFVGAGQSNSTSCGQELTKEQSGMVSSFDGSSWRLADDPQLGAHDKEVGGSFWPAFGDAMYEKYRVPIGVAVTGHSGTSVNEWQPNGELFQWMMVRIHQLGPLGFRAMLWHQGEADTSMDPQEYAGKLATVIDASKTAAGWEFPWFIAQATYHSATEASFPAIRDAQKSLWINGIAQEGPDTDTLTSKYRDYGGEGIHFSPKGLSAHGKLWAEKVGVYLDKVLKP